MHKCGDAGAIHFQGCAPLKHSPYIVIILLVSLKSKMPLGEETSNWSRWDLSREHRRRVRDMMPEDWDTPGSQLSTSGDSFSTEMCRLPTLMCNNQANNQRYLTSDIAYILKANMLDLSSMVQIENIKTNKQKKKRGSR